MILFYSTGSRDDDNKLSSRVRKFYKKQDELIDSFEELHDYNVDDTNTIKLNKQRKQIDWMIRATVVCNCVSKETKINIKMKNNFFNKF